MGLFDFFKKKEKVEIESENNFSDLDESIKRREQRTKEKENQIIFVLKEKINIFLKKLSTQIDVLENIDLKDSRSDERLKFIVLENLSNYINHLKSLSEKLKKIEKENCEEFIEEMQGIFLEFKKNSKTSREKSTYLIGKEIRDVKENFGDFFESINNYIEEEKLFFDEISSIKEIKETSEKISSMKDSRLNLEEEKTSLENELYLLKENLENTLSNINRMKETSEYKEQEEKKQKTEKLKEEIKKQLLDLKNIINFKELYGMYHHEPKKMEIIKEYEESFSKILSEKNEKFLEMIQKEKKKLVLEILEEIKKNYLEFKERSTIKNPVEILFEDKQKYEKNIEEVSIELEKRKKSLEKIDISQNGAEKSIALLFEKIDSNYKD